MKPIIENTMIITTKTIITIWIFLSFLLDLPFLLLCPKFAYSMRKISKNNEEEYVNYAKHLERKLYGFWLKKHEKETDIENYFVPIKGQYEK